MVPGCGSDGSPADGFPTAIREAQDMAKAVLSQGGDATSLGIALAPFPDGAYARAYRNGIAQPQEFANEHASGGVYTTPTDLAAFARVFLMGGMVDGTRVLSPQSVEEMGLDQTQGSFNPAPATALAYGLGWDTVTDSALASVGVRGWSKNGGIVHYGAQILVAPREGLAVVV